MKIIFSSTLLDTLPVSLFFALHTQPADIIPRSFDRKILLPSLLPLPKRAKFTLKIYTKFFCMKHALVQPYKNQ